jgi:RNA polymerase sigma-70 factor (ECF subfamily)
MIRERLEDIDLIQNILDNNQNAENILYIKYKKIVTDYIKSKYSNLIDIDDDVSEILIKVFFNLKKFDSNKSKFKSWVITITKNHMIDKWRCSSNTINVNALDCSSKTTNVSNSSNYFENNYSHTTSFENSNTLNYLSTQISCNDFTLLNMKYVEGYNYDEIGREFQITSSTVSNRINYIKTKLKKNTTEEVL